MAMLKDAILVVEIESQLYHNATENLYRCGVTRSGHFLCINVKTGTSMIIKKFVASKQI